MELNHTNLITNNEQIQEEYDLNANNSNILFEASDIERDTGLIIFEQRCQRFQLHLWNAMTDQAMIIDLDKHDITKLVDSLYGFTDLESSRDITIQEDSIDDGLNLT